MSMKAKQPKCLSCNGTGRVQIGEGYGDDDWYDCSVCNGIGYRNTDVKYYSTSEVSNMPKEKRIDIARLIWRK